MTTTMPMPATRERVMVSPRRSVREVVGWNHKATVYYSVVAVAFGWGLVIQVMHP